MLHSAMQSHGTYPPSIVSFFMYRIACNVSLFYDNVSFFKVIIVMFF